MSKLIHKDFQSGIKRPVVVAGYPKSGNTWITRLVAELLQCPVSGFWQSSGDRKEIACEGEHRISMFECYKSHHPLKVFKKRIRKSKDIHLIHVVRDPRDIAVSGANFFLLEKEFMLDIKRFLDQFSRSGKLYNLLVNHIKKSKINRSLYAYSGSSRIDQMIETLIYGNRDLSHWLFPWKEYVNPYLDSEAFLVRYEDMLKNPLEQCLGILDYIGVSRTEAEILSSIEQQSFGSLKKKYAASNDVKKSQFLRVGQSEQWRTQLSEHQKSKFVVFLEELKRLNYPLE